MQTLEFKKVSPEFQKSIEVFFKDLEESGIGRYFHPHPLSKAEAQRISQYAGQDLYYVAVIANRVLGYGLLRGWDEGYTIPSLGISLHPSAQGQGLGRAFMYFLHAATRQRGAVKVKLKCYPDNIRSVNLYKSLGYTFQAVEEDGQLVGLLNLV
ncbi:GNAT family N-acetyltransferase [Desulfobacter vibrioformis]|uniref:GNAT family N-acetyltransferase n=1 Tax=Desulfobacter vibrioformis TaxID=34031 RepID=UPI000554DA2C|nr:GNAT family N-acetyltransferase [Desulfobacter vibrioformis]